AYGRRRGDAVHRPDHGRVRRRPDHRPAHGQRPGLLDLRLRRRATGGRSAIVTGRRVPVALGKWHRIDLSALPVYQVRTRTQPMHVHVLQHVPFEGLGSIHAWLDSHDARVTWTRLFESADFPAPDAPDLVIALGGPMSVNDETEHPWLVAEKHFIHDAIAAG